MLKYSILTDDELVFLSKKGDEEAFNNLFHRYRKYSGYLAKEYMATNKQSEISLDELSSTAFVAVLKAVENFKPGHNSFYPFWKAVAQNDIKIYIRRHHGYAGGAFNNSISLDRIDDESNLPFYNLIGYTDDNLYSEIAFEEIVKALKNRKFHLSTKERQIVFLKMLEYEVDEIAKELHMTVYSVYYSYKSALKKISDFINKHYR